MTVERMILDAVNDARSDIKDVREDIKSLVTRDAAEIETKRVNAEFAHRDQDILDEKTTREAQIAALAAAQARTATNVKWALTGILLPAAGIVTTIVLTVRGT